MNIFGMLPAKRDKIYYDSLSKIKPDLSSLSLQETQIANWRTFGSIFHIGGSDILSEYGTKYRDVLTESKTKLTDPLPI
ncbi:hypothetical protein EG68_09279 [Paragonimus skrjabini miyazakii]|uniref:Uncharacterized protein n=1 Tax=Paragonimus skrjabini miyazakii TaxID=59628 RepID=A0A8S9YKF0_9TREM|nr:hypothetical protein EG68_09279 [Paragonimus skrjabini miyazakii]